MLPTGVGSMVGSMVGSQEQDALKRDQVIT